MKKETTEYTVVVKDEDHAHKFVKGVKNKHCSFYIYACAMLPTTDGKVYDHRYFVEVTRKEFTKSLVHAVNSNYREPFTVQVKVNEEDMFTFVYFS